MHLKGAGYMTLENKYNVLKPTWENLPWRTALKWENEHDNILLLPHKLLKLTFKNIIQQDCWPKDMKKHLFINLKNYFLNYSWLILCGYYFILIKPTGSNRFLFSGKIAKTYLKYNILWGQEELDCIFLVSLLHTCYYHYW